MSSRRTVIRIGDLTSHGGHVISASSSAGTASGKALARMGDLVYCPLHNKQLQKIVQGSSKASLQGKPLALSGDQVSCGAILLPNPSERSTASP